MRRTRTSRICYAGCYQCNGRDTIWEASNAQAVAARHHDATGHTTWVDVYMSITYGDGDVTDPQGSAENRK